jgi:hypothetical protein
MSTESNLHSDRPLESRETHALIGSDKVQGTAVMIGKQSGKVGYAVMSFGGFLGIGEDYYPLPWSLLTYSPRLEGYEVNLSDAQLREAPKYGNHENWDWGSRARTVDDYYKVPPSWS